MNKLQGGLMVISRWVEKDVLKGFLLADTSYHIHLVPLEQIQRSGYFVPYLNAQYDAEYQTLVGTNGCSLTDYPAVNSEYALVKGNGIIVMCNVLDANTKKPIGVVAFNGMGTRFNLTYKKLNELTRKYACCNFKMVVDPQYGQIAVKMDGSSFDTVEIIQPNAKSADKGDNGKKDCVTQSAPSELPVMGVYNVESMRDSEFNQSSNEKLILTLVNMSKLTPYYYTILQAIRRMPAPIGTMGVTEDTLYYDQKFVAELRIPELTFVLIHEIMHIAMQHSSRFGGRTNPELWNICTDLYINSIICNDFGVKFGGGEVSFGNNCSIKTPDFGVYMETIGEKIDLAVDTPESIYARMLKENPNGAQSAGTQAPSGAQGQKGQAGSQSGGQDQQQQIKEAIEQIQRGMAQVKQGAQEAQQNANNSGSQQAGQQIQQGLNEVQNAINSVQQNQMQQAQQQAQKGMQSTQNGVNGMNKVTQGQQQGQKGGQQPNNQQGSQPGGQSSQDQMARGMNQIQQGLSKLFNASSAKVVLVPGDGGNGQGNQDGSSQGQGKGQGSKGQGQQGQGQQQQGQKGQGQQSGQDQGQSQQSNLAEDDFGGSGAHSPMQEVSVVYNGKKLTGTIMRDVLTKNNSKLKDDVQQKLNDSRRALQTIDTKLKLAAEENGEPLEKNAGAGGHLTKRYIEVGLSAGVDWRVIFRNICKDKPKKTFTLAQPNSDYMNMGMTIADRRRIGKPERVSHVKFAIDVSGSVSKKELMVVLSEINNIFNYYKLDGELLYWSTMVGDAGSFSSLKDMLKIEPATTGGTDCRCVFDYLSGKSKVHGMQEKDRIRDMKAIFIITDGCFSMNFSDYKEMFGRRVVWLITGPKGNTITFDPPFGRVLSLNIDM